MDGNELNEGGRGDKVGGQGYMDGWKRVEGRRM